VSKWETAREEQNAARLCQSEKNLECQLTDLKDNINMELKCHVEIETYMRQAIAVSNYTHGCHSLNTCQHIRLFALHITKQVGKCPQGVKIPVPLCYCPVSFLCLIATDLELNMLISFGHFLHLLMQGHQGLLSVFFGVFTAEEVNAVGHKGSGDTKKFNVQRLWRPF
jgi:hypothetical protein